MERLNNIKGNGKNDETSNLVVRKRTGGKRRRRLGKGGDENKENPTTEMKTKTKTKEAVFLQIQIIIIIKIYKYCKFLHVIVTSFPQPKILLFNTYFGFRSIRS